jgi:hypothetical protein
MQAERFPLVRYEAHLEFLFLISPLPLFFFLAIFFSLSGLSISWAPGSSCAAFSRQVRHGSRYIPRDVRRGRQGKYRDLFNVC